MILSSSLYNQLIVKNIVFEKNSFENLFIIRVSDVIFENIILNENNGSIWLIDFSHIIIKNLTIISHFCCFINEFSCFIDAAEKSNISIENVNAENFFGRKIDSLMYIIMSTIKIIKSFFSSTCMY